ncbi:DUF3224 domain-containing protein [Veronia pacifica]|uniref:DUF3224 domain-containing protein n=1 Tax=Veronia pacifica TaxID=1080227 RepID=A0A1C3EPN0_9GAMM|nr:DUF3224 domain-containing protein [Veronia pacifica]ODA35173.1 hypothetical protein A8L45_04460 [Veronia pacifica]
MKISGQFSVTLTGCEPYHPGSEGNRLSHMNIEKVFSGPLRGDSRGEMLSARTSTEGAAGYVAIEDVQAVLEGRKGSFVLQHFGVMSEGHDRLILEVVPQSGTGQLKGLSGKMHIYIEQGQHFYEFDYRLPQ